MSCEAPVTKSIQAAFGGPIWGDLRQELSTQVQGTIKITSEEYKNLLK